MDIANIISATQAGKLNWYEDNSTRGRSGPSQKYYLCTLNAYNFDVSVSDNTIEVTKDNVSVFSASDAQTLVSEISSYLVTKAETERTNLVGELNDLLT